MIYQIVKWCSDYNAYVAPDSCGTFCSGYKPRNKKQGACKFYRKLRLTRQELIRLIEIGYQKYKEEVEKNGKRNTRIDKILPRDEG